MGWRFYFPLFSKMIISPEKRDFSTIFHVIGRLCLGLSMFMLLPLFCALVFGEYEPFYDFLIGFLSTASLGFVLMLLFPFKKEIGWQHSFFIVSLGWLVASVMGAIPLYLSRHWESFLDAWFEAMSGFATTGLILVKDLDHLSFSHNLWRHLTMFIGGQGIILASISILSKVRNGSLGLYIGEGRQEKIFPNIIATARFIWKVSFIYLTVGVTLFTFLLSYKGLGISKAIVHGFCLFFASFDTGGFAPQSQNIAYYHSFSLEIATMVFMLLGAINFNLHFWLWYKNKREIFRNFEIRTFIISLFSLTILLFFSLKPLTHSVIFRKGFYQLVSAHTGCGFTNLAPREILSFAPLSLTLLILAMGIGGGVCSTTGGIKLLRLGFIFKAMAGEIKRAIMPHKAVYRESFHHLKDTLIEEKHLKETFVIVGFYFLVYLLGGLMGLFHGYPPLASFFESVSAAANVGLSLGVTNPGMPSGLKLTYICEMWMGRLEFLSIFVSLSYIVSLFKK
ncbi:MAG TPA: TrkH family potassium uptake protein [Candidatus Omnitrophica bacterium]|nr:TrkH family potassium uptake protein [Candidatus Omnitrophota bacterium]